MDNENPVDVLFLGKIIQRLELKEVNESGSILNLTILSKNKSIKTECSDDWMILSPGELSTGENEPVQLSLRIVPDRWEHSGDYTGKINFHTCTDTQEKQTYTIEVIVHFKKTRTRDIPLEATGSDTPPLEREIEETGEPAGSAGYTCRECGASLPDKRPLCSACRKKKARQEQDMSALREKYSFNPRHLKSTGGIISSGNQREVILWAVTGAMVLFLILIMIVIALKAQSGDKYRGFGSLSITTKPPGALIVFQDGEFTESPSPLKISSIRAGIHKIQLQMDNYCSSRDWHDIEVIADRENSYDFQLSKAGKLHVQSIPSSYSVSLDGQSTGSVTPVLLEKVPAGSHTVKVGDSDREYRIEVRCGEIASIFTLDEPSKSGLSLQCIKDTKVYVDGTYVGKTPLPPFLLEPGNHKISLVKSDCVPWVQQLKFFPGEVAELSVDPVSSSTLILEGEKGLSLYINGKYNGTIPQKITCDPGKKMALKVVSGDNSVWEKELTLLPGEYRKELVYIAPPERDTEYAVTAGKNEKADIAARYEFYDFNMAGRFPPKDWKVVETLYEDVDYDGSTEMLVALQGLKRKKHGGETPLFLQIVKRAGYDFKTVNLQVPGKEGIGEGEIYGLVVYKTDDLGYREIEYVCGNKRGSITSSGAFIIYHGALEKPSWVARTIQ